MDDFVSILHTVKRKDRTNQLKVLAALYSLGGLEKPVDSSDVRDLIELHLPKKEVPINIPGKLRSYSAYVRLSGKGLPLRWLLMDAGLQELRESTGLSLAKKKELRFDSDIGFVCALEQPEFVALHAALGAEANWKEIGSPQYAHVYREAVLETASGKKLRVVATTSSSMGLTAASIVTTQLVLQFRPRIVVMVGIAAGTKDGGKQFGDVLVADPSVDYNSGKVVRNNGIREFQPDPYPIGLNARLRSLLLRHRGTGLLLQQIRASWEGKVPASENRLHVGPLGAADQVIDDADRIIEIQRNWRKLIGIEMETYGVYRACHEAPEPKPRVVSFKAVCDFAAEKTDSWQEYAAYVAAEFAVRFLKQDWELLWPET
jgi:nucleoside phosphorylase